MLLRHTSPYDENNVRSVGYERFTLDLACKRSGRFHFVSTAVTVCKIRSFKRDIRLMGTLVWCSGDRSSKCVPDWAVQYS